MAACRDWSGERMAGLTNCQPQSPPTLKGRRGSALPPPYLRPTSTPQGEEKAVEKWTLKGTWTRLERAFAAKMADVGKGRDNR